MKKIADAVSQIIKKKERERNMKWDKGEGIKWHEGVKQMH